MWVSHQHYGYVMISHQGIILKQSFLFVRLNVVASGVCYVVEKLARFFVASKSVLIGTTTFGPVYWVVKKMAQLLDLGQDYVAA